MDVFSAVADPVRRGLLEQLAHGGAARVVDLTRGRGISRPAVSRHLRVLGEAGLVTVTAHGRERHYALEPAPLRELASWAAALAGTVPSRATASGAGPAPGPPVPEHPLDALGLEVRRTVRDRGGRARDRAPSDPGATDRSAPRPATAGESA